MRIWDHLMIAIKPAFVPLSLPDGEFCIDKMNSIDELT